MARINTQGKPQAAPPKVVIDTTEMATADVAAKVLEACLGVGKDFLFSHDNRLKVVTESGALIKSNALALGLLLEGLVRFQRESNDRTITVDAPKALLKLLLGIPENGAGLDGLHPLIDIFQQAVPTVDRLFLTPSFGPDCSLMSEPGFDRESRTFIARHGLNVAPIDGMSSADAASEILGTLLGGFPFAGDADRANTMAVLVHGIAWPMISGGLVPWIVIRAPAPGTGKSLLAEAICRVWTGTIPTTVLPSDNKEEGKFLPLVMDRPMVVIDNKVGTFGGPNLRAIATAPGVATRTLGTSAIQESAAANGNVFIFTGNNIDPALQDDARRSVLIDLDAGLEDPGRRAEEEFPLGRGDDYRQAITADRGKWLSLLATMVQRWIDADRPEGPVMPGFEDWSRTMGGIVQHAGLEGFLGNSSDLVDQVHDTSALVMGPLLALWWTTFGTKEVGAVDVLDKIGGNVEELTGYSFNKFSFGRFLIRHRNSTVGDFKLRSRKAPHSKVWRYRVERIGVTT